MFESEDCGTNIINLKISKLESNDLKKNESFYFDSKG